ncbi:MAG: F420-0--gamma-glutamyl ligase [Clostridia bacterium]|nr:F420-0--gamma-glutamyl ligase [Clostridia bacterium]
MERRTGTISRGIRAPIIREGDDLAKIVTDSIYDASREEHFALRPRDIVGVTEAVVARAQGNYATVDQIAEDVRRKFGDHAHLGVLFPILSRNRFAVLLRGIARGAEKIYLQLSYPTDEVGNALISMEQLDQSGLDPWRDVLSFNAWMERFGKIKHPFTGVDYVSYYADIIRGEGTEAELFFANDPCYILEKTDEVLSCDIHSRERTKIKLRQAGGRVVHGLDDILRESVDGSGWNEKYGLLGSNKATDEKVKLFPRDCAHFVYDVQARIKVAMDTDVEVLVYGDGAFRDPVGKIWELADPVVSPAYTKGLMGTPNELKLKYLADDKFADLSGSDLKFAITEYLKTKDGGLVGQMESQGTTPRQIADLIGSLCDLTSGSGDKGTPIVLIQGYFDTYAD